MIFSSFGSVIATTVFLIFVGTLVFCLLDSDRGTTESEKRRWKYKKRLYRCLALVLSGPFWGGLIGVFGGILDMRNKTDSRVGIEFGKGVVVGAVGGAVLLTALSGAIVMWTLWQMTKASNEPDKKLNESIVVKPQANDVEKG